MVHDPQAEMWTFNDLSWDGKPIRRVGINFGAPGDRRAANGTLWLDYPSTGGPSPDVPVEVTAPQAPRYFRYHSSRVRADPNGPGLNWVASSGVTDVSAVTLTVAKEDVKPRQYTVRLHFAEVTYLKPGRRVFNVALQGREVLRGLDVVKQAGGVNRAVVKGFRGVEIADRLTVSFSQTGQTGSAGPVLCGIELVAQRW